MHIFVCECIGFVFFFSIFLFCLFLFCLLCISILNRKWESVWADNAYNCLEKMQVKHKKINKLLVWNCLSGNHIRFFSVKYYVYITLFYFFCNNEFLIGKLVINALIRIIVIIKPRFSIIRRTLAQWRPQ